MRILCSMEQVFSVGAEKRDQDILSIYMFTIYKLNLIISFKLPSQMMTIGKKNPELEDLSLSCNLVLMGT